MDLQPNNLLTEKREIRFPNGNRAVLVRVGSHVEPAELIKALEIKKPATVLLLIGGAEALDQSFSSQLEQLFSRGLARAAVDTEAIIIDGGTNAGVMELMGKAVADRDRQSLLLGVAPAGKVTYPGDGREGNMSDLAQLDPNHSHFVLVEGDEWSSGNEMLFNLANELAPSRVVVLLVNGGEETKDEVLRSVRHGWPVVIIEGSGRLADDLARRSKASLESTDPVTVEIISEGNLLRFPLTGSAADLRRFLVKQSEQHLVEAWRRFARYDSKAAQEQTLFRRTLFYTLMLGVLGTLFALLEKQSVLVRNVPSWIMTLLGYIVIALPVVVSVLLTVSNRSKRDKKWIVLRNSGEAVKKEIFRYRTRVGEYGYKKPESSQPPLSREQVLVKSLKNINRRLMTTEVNTGSVPEYEGSLPPKNCVAPGDDGFSPLTPDKYIEFRVTDQLDFYSRKTRKLERQLVRLQWTILTLGGAGTLLANFGAKLWITLTTAAVTGLTAYVGQLHIERTLVHYNLAGADLSDLRAWWNALPSAEKLRQANIELLVDQAEKILEGERAAWIRQMQPSPARLRAKSLPHKEA